MTWTRNKCCLSLPDTVKHFPHLYDDILSYEHLIYIYLTIDLHIELSPSNEETTWFRSKCCTSLPDIVNYFPHPIDDILPYGHLIYINHKICLYNESSSSN